MDHVKAIRHIEEKSADLGLGRDGSIDLTQLHIIDNYRVRNFYIRHKPYGYGCREGHCGDWFKALGTGAYAKV